MGHRHYVNDKSVPMILNRHDQVPPGRKETDRLTLMKQFPKQFQTHATFDYLFSSMTGNEILMDLKVNDLATLLCVASDQPP